MATTSRFASWALRLARSSSELGNESTKCATVWSQRPSSKIWARQVAGNALADQFRVLVGPVAPHELQARSNSLLAHTAMRQQELGFSTAARNVPRHFFLAAPPRPPPRRQSPRKAPFPPVGPLPRGQSPFPTAPAPRAQARRLCCPGRAGGVALPAALDFLYTTKYYLSG